MPCSRRAFALSLAGSVAALSSVAPLSARAEEAPKKPDYIVLGDFTLSLPIDGRRRNYVVIGITLDAKPTSSAEMKDMTPRLKDAVLRRLMAMSDRGQLLPNQTDPLVVKDAVFEAVSKIEPNGLNDVLITRLLYS